MVMIHEPPADDPQLVAAANAFVDDIIQTAKVVAAQRNEKKCNGSRSFETNIKKINEWQNRAKGVFRRFMTTICVRFQDLTSK